MDTSYKIQTIGSMAKLETLHTITSNVLPNTFVIENREPFPGYHGKNLPTEPIPDSVFFITTQEYSYEKIQRIGQKIRRFMHMHFDACYAKICVYNDTYPAIRLRDIDNYGVVQEIQQYFMDEGIKYRKTKRLEAPCIIQLRKHFDVTYGGDDIFVDNTDDSMYYLAIPYQISWSLFKDITFKIKNNIDNNNFDAALGCFYLKDIVEFVRIYANQLEPDRLKLIRSKYVEELKKYF